VRASAFRFEWNPLACVSAGLALVCAVLAIGLGAGRSFGANAEPKGLLETIHRHRFLTSTIPDNGDVNPYAVVVAPVSVGVIEQGDVLVDNFNNISNLQGTGTTIVRYRPSTKETKLFAQVPQKLKDCPGGVGLTTAMTMLKRGWIIVGSTPSTDGTTATKGEGCVLVFDAEGHHVATWAGPTINGPWGDMATVDRGDSATLFISMAGFGVPGPQVVDPVTHYPVIVRQATVLRLDLTIPEGKPPVLVSQTVVGDGYSQRSDRDNFLFGPTGLSLGPNGTLYVTDGLDNEITAIPQAITRTDSAGKGQPVTQGGLLQWPLAMVMTSEGHLIVCNGKNGQAVEVDPATGKQIYAHWLNIDQAQSPPGNGNLFGLAMAADGKSFYYVEDDINSLRIATP
jgi:hypothetical protein